MPVRKSYLWVLLVLLGTWKKISTQTWVLSNLKKKMRNVIMLSTKCSLGKGFRLLKTLSTNNGFERSDLIFGWQIRKYWLQSLLCEKTFISLYEISSSRLASICSFCKYCLSVLPQEVCMLAMPPYTRIAHEKCLLHCGDPGLPVTLEF